MSETYDRDELARKRICEETDKNFFVEAGAGSGKTYSLVKRMVSMVINGIEIDKICAITFTKAAAGEFYSRFYDELNKELGTYSNACGDKDSIICRRLKNAIDNFDTCFMGTLDSFCSMVISEHPAEAGVPADAGIVDSSVLQTLYINELSRIANGDYGSELLNKYLAFKSVNGRYKDTFSRCIAFMAEKRTSEFVSADGNTALERAKEKIGALKGLDAWIENHDIAPYEGRKFSVTSAKLFKEKSYLITANIKNSFSEIFDFFKKLTRLSFDKDADLGPYVSSFYEDGQRNVTLTLNSAEILTDLKKYRFAVTVDFVSSAIDEISKELKKKGNLTFFDYKLYLRDLLKKDAENGCRLIDHIYRRHSYYLIDEFQDTNPLQYEIVFYLAAGRDAVEQWDKCIPKPGSVFIVGDPKQSIYRFQGADIESFNKVKSLFDCGIAGETLVLTKNFRSTEVLGDWFNRTFEKKEIFPAEATKYQCRYSPIPAEAMRKISGEFSGVYYYRTEKNGPRSDDPENVCNIIRKIVGNSKYKVIHGNEETPSEITYGDIMVITRTKSNISDYTKLFTKRGIPSFAEGKVEFGNSGALCLVSLLLTVIADPNDSISLYKVLRSDLFGISKNEIYAYTYNGRAGLNTKSVKEIQGCEKLAHSLETLAELRKKAKAMSPVSAMEAIADEFRVFSLTGADYYECFIQARELLRDAESTNSVLSLKEAAEYLNGFVGGSSGQERCLSLNKNRNAVRVANLHKVKGLEAPVVILATYETRNFPTECHIEINNGTKYCYINSIQGAYGSVILDSAGLFEAAISEEKAFEEAEEKRLLYVAATRARSVLVIGQKFDGSTRSDKVLWNPLTDMQTAEDFDEAVTGEISEPAEPDFCYAEDMYKMSEENSVITRTSSLEKTYELHLPSKEDNRKPAKNTETDEPYENTSEEEKTDNSDAALKGTLVHALMEILVSSGAHADIGITAKNICRAYGADEKYISMLTSVGKTLFSGGYEQSNGFVSDILAFACKDTILEKHCELPFCYMKEGRMANGVMDLVVNDGGRWHIIDYKTDADKEASYSAHEAQLDEYVKAFREITGNDAESHIYHIGI